MHTEWGDAWVRLPAMSWSPEKRSGVHLTRLLGCLVLLIPERWRSAWQFPQSRNPLLPRMLFGDHGSDTLSNQLCWQLVNSVAFVKLFGMGLTSRHCFRAVGHSEPGAGPACCVPALSDLGRGCLPAVFPCWWTGLLVPHGAARHVEEADT